jgi:hypothetical protein
MPSNYHCLWCGNIVDHKGYTCSEHCYDNLCRVLASGEPYLSDEDDPPLDLYRQPWAREKESEDDI